MSRVGAERLALRLAAGAARDACDVFLSARRSRPGTSARAVVLRAGSAARRGGHACPASTSWRRRAAAQPVTRLSMAGAGESGRRDRRRRIRSRRARQPGRRQDPMTTTGAAHYLLGANAASRASAARAGAAMAQAMDAGGRAGRSRTRGARRRWTSIARTRVPIRRPRCSISRRARIAFCSSDPSTRAARRGRGDRDDRSAHARRAVRTRCSSRSCSALRGARRAAGRRREDLDDASGLIDEKLDEVAARMA